MDQTERLKAVLQDLINDRHSNAEVTMHDYFVSKTREVAGLGQTVDDTSNDDDTSDDE